MCVTQITSFREISDRYDAILCDIWGVLHNGVTSFADASNCLASFRSRGGIVVLLTNAPRPSAIIGRQLLKLGVLRDAFDSIVTSGDVTAQLIADRIDDPVLHIGPSRDLSLFEAVEKAAGRRPTLVQLENASYAVCTGLRDDSVETLQDYETELCALAFRSMTLLCANPDIVIHRGDALVYCAGALARRYEELGGAVTYAGKPYPPTYRRAMDLAVLARGAPIDTRRVLAIGDAMMTDIAGATDAGFDALFITGGIHRAALHGEAQSCSADPAELQRLCRQWSLWPTASMAALRE
jgi:HAD superfamily hydrolase (TIGR01459 family)